MKYDLSSFLDGDEKVYHIEGELSSKDLTQDSNLEIINPIKFNGEIYKVDGQYQIHINISYTYDSICDRCLKPTTEEVNAILSGELKAKKGIINDDEDELDEIIFYENDLLDLKEYIWNRVVGSLPMKSLCSEDCQGLCSQCGVDLNTQSCECMGNAVDLRLEKLKDFFPKK